MKNIPTYTGRKMRKRKYIYSQYEAEKAVVLARAVMVSQSCPPPWRVSARGQPKAVGEGCVAGGEGFP